MPTGWRIQHLNCPARSCVARRAHAGHDVFRRASDSLRD